MDWEGESFKVAILCANRYLMNTRSKSNQDQATGCSRIFPVVFGIFFFSGGAFFFWMITINPVLRWQAAKSWESTDCRILSSKVDVSHDDEGGTSYNARITYEYTVDKQRYEGDKIRFGIVTSSRKNANKDVGQYPKNAKATCFYNPKKPSDSVLQRGSPFTFWMFFPLPFMLIGLGVLYWGLFGKVERSKVRRRRASEMSGQMAKHASSSDGSDIYIYEADEEDEEWSKPQKLKPSATRLQTLLIAGAISLFWNGIVSIFVYNLLDGGFAGQNICVGLFLVPFVLVGIGMIVFFFHSLLAMFNPKGEIAMSSGAVALGQSVDLAWEFSGNVRRFRNLKIELAGTESATYRRGTSTHTDKSVFRTIPIIDTTNHSEMDFGNQTVNIPASTMHTFEADNNSVVWTVEVHGDIALWPDVKFSFPFRVKPQG